jgi:hypothetical protein
VTTLANLPTRGPEGRLVYYHRLALNTPWHAFSGTHAALFLVITTM